MDDIRETAWDHVSGEKTATISTSEKKWIRLIESLKEKYPEQVEIRYRNPDGSILARLPAEWMKIKPKKKSNMTPEQKEASKARLELARHKRLDSLRQTGDAVVEKEGKS